MQGTENVFIIRLSVSFVLFVKFDVKFESDLVPAIISSKYINKIKLKNLIYFVNLNDAAIIFHPSVS